MRFTRRRFLTAAGGTAVLGSLAGCTGSSGAQATTSEGSAAQASFFVFGDLTMAVAGDAATTALLTPVGQHGHGWEPGPRVREAISDASLFVHGMTGFQPWVDRILPDLEADGSNVLTVDASTGVELLDVAADHGHTHEDDESHDDAASEAHDGPEHDDDDDHDEGEGEGDHDEHDTHAGSVDPHFWMDPLRVAEAITPVRRGLETVDEDNGEMYATNAEELRARLTALHERTRSVLDRRTRDVLLVAGHNSFRYFGDRYGVTVEALSNVSPDDRPTARDIERAREIIADHGLRYVCADPLESQRAAEQLVAETDAEAVLPLTALPGLTPEWEEAGWGYVDVVENVNLPTLERALVE